MTIDMTNITHSEGHNTLADKPYNDPLTIIITMKRCHKNNILCANCSLMPLLYLYNGAAHIDEYGKYKCLLLMIPVTKTFFSGDDENLKKYDVLLNNEN